MLDQLPASSCASNIDSQSGNLFLLLLNTLLASQCALKNTNLYPPNKGSEIKDGDHFDFIVVGAGSAGSVVGSRLVETNELKVLVLEAGDYPEITTEIPALFFNIELTHQIWNYKTEPSESSCLGYNNKSCSWPRGKLLGGCSSINAMLYIRGNKGNYDLWEKLGNVGWDYQNVMKYFKKSERLLADLEHPENYGKDGLLPITKYTTKESIRDIIFESAKELGYKVFSQEGELGFFEALTTIENGTRANTAKIFLGSVKDSEKLTLATNAHVKKLIIDKPNKSVKGVEVKIGEKTLNVFADKEVILSAGALNSPQILMLSGIGPKKHLTDVGIEAIHDLNVGQNLEDHLVLWFFAKIDANALNSTVLIDEIYDYFAHRKGEFSNIGLANIQGFINTKNDSNYPNIQYIYVTGIKKDEHLKLDLIRDISGMNDESMKILHKISEEHGILCIAIILLQPKSKGEVLLKNNNPFDDPLLRTGYLTNDEDLETLLEGIHVIKAQLNTGPFRKINAEVIDLGLNYCKSIKYDSDDYWRCFIRNMGTTLYHPTSTCKMGPSNDKTAVVDPRLRVYGMKNLRVIDASIMPKIISGNTNAPTIMIGQKGADMIIEDLKNIHSEL